MGSVNRLKALVAREAGDRGPGNGLSGRMESRAVPA